MERRFKITNVSGGRGLERIWVPFGGSSTIPPGTPRGRRRRSLRKRGRHSAIVPEETLRSLVRFFRSGQIAVEAVDGGPLPDWMHERTGDASEEVSDAPSEPDRSDGADSETSTTDDAPSLEDGDTPSEVGEERESSADMLLEMNAKDVIEAVGGMNDPGFLALAYQVEAENKDRKTVLSALEDRLKELTQ